MEILKAKREKEAIEGALAVLRKGGLIIYPTETCYGIGADATNTEAVKKALEFKGSRGGKPISVAVVDKAMAEKYVELNEMAKNLYQKFLPGPLTMVSKSRGKVVKYLEAGKGNLGIRMPDYPLVLKIIKKLRKPITSTSANASGKKTPYSLKDIQKYTPKKSLRLVDLFLDRGKLPYNPPSTVVDTTLNEPKILRQGEISLSEIKGKFFISNSEKETKKIAGEIFEKFKKYLFRKPLIFALQGELGAGKTQFAKGLARTLGIKANVVSPTFTIIREYPLSLNLQRTGLCKSTFYHLDTWRLEKGEELLDLGLESMLKPGNVVVIEWLQKVKVILDDLTKKAVIVWVEIKVISEKKRKISYQS